MAGLSRNVRAHRFALMQRCMRSHGHDALAFTSADWFEWVSNCPIADQPFERPFLVIVTVDGASFAVTSELSRHSLSARRQCGLLWLDDVMHYAESPDRHRHAWRASQWNEMVAEALVNLGLDRGRIAADFLSERSIGTAAHGSQVRWVAAGAELRNLRRVKHADELATMRQCAALADWAMGVYREELLPERLLREIDHLVAARLAVEAARRLPEEDFVIRSIGTSCGASSARVGGAMVRLGKDSVAAMSLSAQLNGLTVELARPWLIGTPDRHAQERLACARAAQEAAIAAVVAGRAISGIHAEAQSAFDRAGYGSQLRLRAAHGIGVVQHDYPVDVPFDDRPLLEHEVYAVEPAMYLAEEGTFRFADTIAVGVSGPEPLTKADKETCARTLGSLQ